MGSLLQAKAPALLPPTRSMAAAVEERFLFPAYASGWARVATAAHRALALPLQLIGPARARRVTQAGGELRLLELGRPKVTEAVTRRLLGPLPVARELGPRPLFLNPPAGETDLVVAEVHRWLAPRYRDAGWLIVPTDVRWQGDIAAVPPAHPSRSLRSDLAKVGRFTVAHTRSPEAWAEFEAVMLQPQALARFGPEAWTPSTWLLRRLARDGVLHLVSLDGRSVSASCSVLHGDRLWTPLMGVRDGDPALVRAGALVAAMAFAYEWGRREGCRRIDAGRTSPFLSDGVARTKRKWGLRPVLDPLTPVAAVWVGSDPARAAFAREPVMVETGHGLALHPAAPA